ncbi:dephospho-CoA kinase [Carnobacterium alterfunditum]|uniref:Dephospho-CoA kinase n=1 Tax=Carnobacterium alterfunditum TaxID=28230 RepID=A0A1N6GC15_9LACT|nr:dephospho-CoA kinase [Carnobacterium alterfunditum]SIO05065.1 dephospho-CoA kinase [Carnobacterium alterfunditum]
MTVILGLTGGISTGKSTVSKIFKEQGYPVVDADVGAREVVKPGTDGLEKIKKEFGNKVILTDGTLDRTALAKIIFDDVEKRELLNKMLSQHIHQWIVTKKNDYLKQDPAIIVLDIPLLFEMGYENEVDQIMVVATSEEIQLNRLMKRDNIEKKEATQRINSQLPISKKVILGDIIIDNSGTIENTKKQVLDWINKNKD